MHCRAEPFCLLLYSVMYAQITVEFTILCLYAHLKVFPESCNLSLTLTYSLAFRRVSRGHLSSHVSQCV